VITREFKGEWLVQSFIFGIRVQYRKLSLDAGKYELELKISRISRCRRAVRTEVLE
jgi:hypothetical protein